MKHHHLVIYTYISSILVMLAIISTPISVYAALNAGVVNGVWFSQTEPVAGTEIRIFTAIQNQSSKTIAGTVSFLVNSEIIGSTPFSVTSNDVVPVSIAYTFLGGEHDVSAYITSVEDANVTYTIVSETSISIGQQKNDAPLPNASSTIIQAAETLTETSKNILGNIEPLTQKTAQRVEAFRDTLIVASSTNEEVPATKIAAVKTFIQDTQSIATSDHINIGKKTIGIVLSLFAFLLRMWFIFIVALAIFVFWRLVRGQRIT